jgi:non-specific serine/threonine protein kinase/serine/threonine-protein kinase
MVALDECKSCGSALPPGALDGLCPRCLIDAAFATEGRADRTMTMATSDSERHEVSNAATPAVIARYRIVRLIGEGGMGSVYEAEQENPRRTVALKVIKPGIASAALLRRFEQEAEALGRLQHAGIAQIYEAGTADTGFGPQPYFAMELIRGVSLKEYVRQLHLSTRQRVELMAKICDAVQHAHQKGLIHRDLKPGNILVDETGQPKIVDFGVARITDKDAQATSNTDAGQLIGTLAYMSPEQVLADPLELDTRSDVYTLGVILYEMLAGRLPYQIGNKLHEALNAIREVDPHTLSSVDGAYRGDLETIAAKALEKDKSRRYNSAAELGADLRRYLTDEPIVARPPSLTYQVTKFARRHTAVVAGACAVFIVLVAGIVVSTILATKANREALRAKVAEQNTAQTLNRAIAAEKLASGERDRAKLAEAQADRERDLARQERDNTQTERDRAETESAVATAVTNFLRNLLFEQATASVAPGADPDGAMRLALTRAAAKIEGKYPRQPLAEAAVREEIAKSFMGLAATDEAVLHLERALELRRRALGPDDLGTAATMRMLVPLYVNQDEPSDAEHLVTDLYRIRRAKLGEKHLDTLEAMVNVAFVYRAQNRLDEAVSWMERTVAIAERSLGADNYRPAALNLIRDEFRRTAEQYRGKTAPKVRGGGPGLQDPRIAAGVLRLRDLIAQKSFEEAEKVLRELLDNIWQADGASVAGLYPVLGLLASTYAEQGKYADAERHLLQAVEILRRSGSDWELLLRPLRNLAEVYSRQGKYDEEELTLLRLVKLTEQAQDVRWRDAQRSLATSYFRHRKYAQSEALSEKVVAIVKPLLGMANSNTRNDMGILAVTYAIQRKFTQSEDVLQQLLAAQRGDEDQYLRLTIWTLGWVRLESGHAAEAEALFREALPLIDKVKPDSHEWFVVHSLLGLSLAAQRRYTEAEPLLLAGYQGMQQRTVRDTRPLDLFTLEDAHEAIAKFYKDSGQEQKAVAWQTAK